MTEQPPHLGDEQRLSRRDLFRRAAKTIVGSVVTVTAAHRLTEGISLSKPPLDLQIVSVGRMAGDVQLFSTDTSETDEEKIMTITPEGKLLFEPSGVFFAPGKQFNYVHRGGNSLKSIDEAYRKGADLFDIDANAVGDTVRGEHGLIPQVELHLGRRGIHLYLPVVFDVNEEEVKLGMPNTYEELIAHIASLSTPEYPLAVSTELKRGRFELNTLRRMFDIHQEYNVPAIVHSTDPQQLEAVNGELASVYNVLK